MNTPTSGAADLPEALRLAAELDHGYPLVEDAQAAAAELRRLHALAAGQAVAPADGWLQDGGMLYRLTDERHPCNRDEISVTMADGSRSLEDRAKRAGELLNCIRARPWPLEEQPDGTVNPVDPADMGIRPAPPAMDGGDAVDAARYRWLRHGDNDEKVLCNGPVAKDYWYLPRNEKLDAAIDAARAAQKEGEKP